MNSLDNHIFSFAKQLVDFDNESNTLIYSLRKCSLKELINYKKSYKLKWKT